MYFNQKFLLYNKEAAENFAASVLQSVKVSLEKSFKTAPMSSLVTDFQSEILYLCGFASSQH